VNAIGQRQTVSTSGTAMASPATTRWSYDALGQLVAEDFANNQAANPRDRGYAYDLIGNRENSIQGNTNPLAAGNLSYDANPLNQYTSIGAFQPVHDDDGNLTSGRLHSSALSTLTGTPYTGTLHWNAENRLTKIEDGSILKATYQYDFMGRRVRKQVGSVVTWYVYDGFNELGRFTQSGTGAPAIQRTFTWGLDISNSPQGAGGVGGLLAVKVHGTTSATYFPTYDANGNISEYLASNGSVAAHFEYDGFGNTVVNTDANGLFDYRFSTKPLEDVSGLYYYLYRDYDPVTGRWLTRDPIDERGGINLYAIVGNNTVNTHDYLGREDAKNKLPKYTLTWKTVEIRMGSCGHFKWTIEWSVKGRNANGMIYQEVVKVADIKNCANPPQGRGPQQIGGLVFESWNWPAGKGGSKDTWSMQDAITALKGQKCQGEYAVQGTAHFTKSKLNSKPAPKPQLPAGVTFADLGMPLLEDGFSMADHQVIPDVDPVTGDQHVNATKDSNTVIRMIQVKWNCCNGQAKTQLVERTPDPK
jgi:RHS repeat-associated protein